MMIFAYLDPGSGSLILQAILGGLAGAAVAFKAWKTRILGKRAVIEAENNTQVTDEPAVSSDS